MATIAEIEKDEIHTIAGLAEHYINELRGEGSIVAFDLGCGKKKLDVEGVRGVDLYLDTDVRADLINEPWDFTPDNSVDFLYASHFLEHVSDINTFMDRAWTKLRDGGLFLITTPYGLSVRAWQDPDHKRPIFRETYLYFNKVWREKQELEHYSAHCDFEIKDIWPLWNKKYASRALNNAELAEQFMTTFGAVDDMTVLLRARKET